ncbi:complement factor H-related protein 4-like isoform X2 [Sinocyclocheilus grahami]|uniref:complement factor H-related protein 4-like isoform X2 n=1 Tax=Sinocyclocheilus grahami TaxID=75366 RepID=UPI0007ACAA98|nr:PREDICTED: complement factor H-related protein 4-like isoform X2 [Sinocyclocheilus grahami]
MNNSFGKQLKMKYCDIFLFLLLTIIDVSTNAQEVICEGEQLINVDILFGHPGIVSPYKPGHILVFRCTDVNLKMHGQRTIECLSNGKWDHPYPICGEVTCPLNTTENNIKMERFPDLEGPVKPGYSLTFSCDGQGLILKGQREITCQSNGEWSNPFPKCLEITCELQTTTFRVIKINPEGKTIFRAGESVEITCSKKRLWFNKETSKTFTCQDNGEWDHKPVCEGIRCEVPHDQHVSHPDHLFRGDMKLGAKQNYYCESGYGKTAEEATCTRDGWTPNPLCAVSRKCGPPPHVNNADTVEMTKKEYNTGERVEYMCFNKYTLDSHPAFSKYLTCQQGEWRGNIKCLMPCSVTVGDMDERGIELAFADQQKMFAPHDDHITFKCQRGKVSVGFALRQKCNDGVITLPVCV